jgi:hypothetical protein
MAAFVANLCSMPHIDISIRDPEAENLRRYSIHEYNSDGMTLGQKLSRKSGWSHDGSFEALMTHNSQRCLATALRVMKCGSVLSIMPKSHTMGF